MFGIALMGILTSCAEGFVGLVGELFRAITSCFGVCVSPCLGMAQGFEFIAELGCQTCMTFLRILTCGLF